ncbi:hypothetical protein ACGFT2_23910 [Streptomyces sp. NPDC048514]|uniref:hypothetical protein n=1 Tax=Streptomyces sp. NPDC048514 TaxID=3365564 RepID=UPI00371831FD
MSRGTTFDEVMVGSVRLDGEDVTRRMRMDLSVRADRLMLLHRTTDARLTGRIRIQGVADDPLASGRIEISPLARRRIRYRLTFTAEGRRYRLDGWKSVEPSRPAKSLTVLPFSLFQEDGKRVGEGTLRFPVTTALLPFLASFRFPRPEAADRLLAPRWDGTAGRTEVWYTTVTDPATRTGLWLHHELVAPSDGSPPYAHGWVAVFPPDGPVRHARFGPEEWQPDLHGFRTEHVSAAPRELVGNVGDFSWQLTEHHEDPNPLYTFPRWSWRRELLPAAQILPSPRSSYTGTVVHPGGELRLSGAPGASARIYGHGNARHWAWLHADLGGGDTLEIVAAVSSRKGLDRLPPLVFLRLRKDGETWPRRVERGAFGWAGLGRFEARLGFPVWTVTGRVGERRIQVMVTLPEERTLVLDYTNPDGSTVVCRNSEVADVQVLLEHQRDDTWDTEAQWSLRGTAHAEVGSR